MYMVTIKLGTHDSLSTQLKPLSQQISKCLRQSCYVSQHNIEGEREGVDVFVEDRLAIREADCLHVQQGAGRVI